jgi:hypothetical protein
LVASFQALLSPPLCLNWHAKSSQNSEKGGDGELVNHSIWQENFASCGWIKRKNTNQTAGFLGDRAPLGFSFDPPRLESGLHKAK